MKIGLLVHPTKAHFLCPNPQRNLDPTRKHEGQQVVTEFDSILKMNGTSDFAVPNTSGCCTTSETLKPLFSIKFKRFIGKLHVLYKVQFVNPI
ncbi:hypothetical protein PUN28_015886 [Cardiocondyla obscurior]|uniref:Uncharacterized protein n=1 Tax=Cardiocondyla obscurior TaxID=286306 RepID=A0AAW2ETS4_9HYME